MAYIGNTVQNQGFAPAVDYFNGDGTTVTFTLSRPVASVAQLTAVIDNVIQNPSSAFTVSGSAITFTSAPLAGTNNIWVEYTSLVTTYAAISQDPSVIGDITASGGYLAVGDFGNTYVDGTIVDYVTGNARITTGPADGLTIYNGGTSARTALLALSSTGNVNIPTAGARITGDFSNATASNRVGFQTSTTNSATDVMAIPNGTSVVCALRAKNSSDPNNSSDIVMFVNNAEARIYSQAVGTGTALPLTMIVGGSERLRIATSGNVGIGTTSPTNKLHVVSDVINAGDTTYSIAAGAATTQTRKLLLGYNDSGNYGVIQAVESGTAWRNIVMQPNDGNVGIGTSSPSAKLQVAGSSIFQDSLQIFNSPSSSAQGILFRNTYNVGASIFSMGPATSNGLIDFVGGSGTQGSIYGNGAGITYGSASDYRLKENVVPMVSALDKVALLKPVTFTWKFDGSTADGFIAHELAEVYPYAVNGEKDGVDEDGNPKHQNIDTSFLVAALTAAIQEQQAMIEELKTKVAALEAK